MSDQIPYLSDEELQKLIADAEQTTVKAPDDLENKVIARIESRERKKTVEFAWYCARVAFGVAAAIALICLVPSLPRANNVDFTMTPVRQEKEIPTREEVLGEIEIKTREEVLSSDKDRRLLDEIYNYFD